MKRGANGIDPSQYLKRPRPQQPTKDAVVLVDDTDHHAAALWLAAQPRAPPGEPTPCVKVAMTVLRETLLEVVMETALRSDGYDSIVVVSYFDVDMMQDALMRLVAARHRRGIIGQKLLLLCAHMARIGVPVDVGRLIVSMVLRSSWVALWSDFLCGPYATGVRLVEKVPSDRVVNVAFQRDLEGVWTPAGIIPDILVVYCGTRSSFREFIDTTPDCPSWHQADTWWWDAHVPTGTPKGANRSQRTRKSGKIAEGSRAATVEPPGVIFCLLFF